MLSILANETACIIVCIQTKSNTLLSSKTSQVQMRIEIHYLKRTHIEFRQKCFYISFGPSCRPDVFDISFFSNCEATSDYESYNWHEYCSNGRSSSSLVVVVNLANMPLALPRLVPLPKNMLPILSGKRSTITMVM